MEKISIFLRSTENWGSLTKIDIENKLNDKIFGNTPIWRPMLLRNIRAWNSCLNVSFAKYRQRLKEIAIKSWLETKLPISDSNDIVCPTDDDDWFHPKLHDYIQEGFSNPKINLVYWDCGRYLAANFGNNSNTIISTDWNQMNYYGSNGYAVRNLNLAEIKNDHVEAKKHFQPNNTGVLYIDKPLSVWVRHLGSTCLLYSHRIKIENFNKIYLPKIDKKYLWAEKYVCDFVELNQSIKAKICLL